MSELTLFDASEVRNAPAVSLRNGEVITNSREVAAWFGKQHGHVLRDIDQAIENIGSPNLDGQYFRQIEAFDYSANRVIRCFDLTKDGFTLIAMGYTGPKAMQFKVAYISEFNRMERELREGLARLKDEVTRDVLAMIGHAMPAQGERKPRRTADRYAGLSADEKTILRIISAAGRAGIRQNALTRKTPQLNAAQRADVMKSLLDRGQVVAHKHTTTSRPATSWHAVAGSC